MPTRHHPGAPARAKGTAATPRRRLRTTVHALAAATLAIDDDGLCIEANSAACALLGRDPTGTPWWSALVATDHERARQRSLAGFTTGRFVISAPVPEPVEVRCGPRCAGVRMLSITTLMLAGYEHTERSGIRHGLWRIDADANTLYVSEQLAEMLATTPEAMVGTPLSQWFEPDDFEGVKALLEQRRAGESGVNELRYRRADGAELWATVSAVAVRDGDEYLGAFAWVYDVTDRRRAESEVRRERELLELVTEQLDEVLWMYSYETGEVVYTNSAWERLWRCRRDELYADSEVFWDAVHPDDRDRTLAEFVERRGKPGSVMYRIVADGTTRLIRHRSFPIECDGRPVALLAIGADVTAEVREQAKREATIELLSEMVDCPAPTNERFWARLETVLRRAVTVFEMRSVALHTNTGSRPATVSLGTDSGALAELVTGAAPLVGLPVVTAVVDDTTAAVYATALPGGRFCAFAWSPHAAIDPLQVGVAKLVHAWIVDQLRRAQYEQNLAASHSEQQALTALLRRLTDHVEQVKESERARIAAELHDELGQLLTSLSIDLQWIALCTAQDGVAERAVEMGHLVQDTMRTVRRLCNDLRPIMLEEGRVADAIAVLCENAARHAPGRIVTEIDDAVAARCYAPEVTSALYRIAQEALTNALRHSGARHVVCRLSTERRGVVLEVSDDGTGISDAAQRGLGIVGMRERALRLGASFELDTGAHGTTVRVRLTAALRPDTALESALDAALSTHPATATQQPAATTPALPATHTTREES